MRIRPVLAASLLLGALGCGAPADPDGASTSPGGSVSLMPPGPKKPSGTVAERVVKAKERAAAGSLIEAIAALEEGMAIDANDRESLGLLARYSMERARAVVSEGTTEYYTRLVSAAEYYRRLRDAHGDLTDAEKQLGLELFYDEATAHAKSLRAEETTGSLHDLVAAGFKDFDRILEDPAWAKMLAVPKFRKDFDAIRGDAKKP